MLSRVLRWKLIDECFGRNPDEFRRLVKWRAEPLATDPRLPLLLREKRRRRDEDEAIKPLAQYRAEELEHMKLNFFGFDPSYHIARYSFIRRIPKSRTPSCLAVHRSVSQTTSRETLLPSSI